MKEGKSFINSSLKFQPNQEILNYSHNNSTTEYMVNIESPSNQRLSVGSRQKMISMPEKKFSLINIQASQNDGKNQENNFDEYNNIVLAD